MRYCEERGLALDEPDDAALADVSAHLTPAVRSVLTVDGSIGSRLGAGGTAPERVQDQLVTLVGRVGALSQALSL